ncbi:peptide deformylase 2-like [Macrosteles quadrilineatus]|uniref:peptide deformylase 2-like n=1 Tax=Macrosteles quadrilineatus TaxID=74068 RepID=UPI0023E1AE17|nr:peptide deformylase 2-like [Macrosteles quadrilineatus]XP_054289423.1 peptide deformylase 2-like [Macrosteles quadrilineatus]
MKLKDKLELYNYMHLHFLSEDFNNPTATQDSVLRKVAAPFEFPLSKDDRNDIMLFKYSFDEREYLGKIDRVYYSISGPQLGISKRMIYFMVPFGRGVVQPFPRSYWLNPSWEPIKEEVEEVVTFDDEPIVDVKDDTEEAYEMCLSTNMAGKVRRHRSIKYTATLVNGKKVTGEAHGLTARIIQHEIDHLDGKLLVDHVPREELITAEEYKKRRKEAWGGKSWMNMQEELKAEHEALKASYPTLFKPKKVKQKKKKKKH